MGVATGFLHAVLFDSAAADDVDFTVCRVRFGMRCIGIGVGAGLSVDGDAEVGLDGSMRTMVAQAEKTRAMVMRGIVAGLYVGVCRLS